MAWLALFALGAAACGRIGFESSTDDAPGGGVCEPPRKLCDGFEGPALDSRWSIRPGISLDPSRAHRGSSSLRVHTDALPVGVSRTVMITDTSVLPQNDPTLYLRVWIQLDRLPLNNMELIEAIAAADADLVGVFVLPDAMTVYSQFEERSMSTPGPAPISTWFCLQFTIVRSRTNGELGLDGDVGEAKLQNVQTEGPAGLTQLGLGIGFAAATLDVPQPAMDVWIDDLVVSTSPISCTE